MQSFPLHIRLHYALVLISFYFLFSLSFILLQENIFHTGIRWYPIACPYPFSFTRIDLYCIAVYSALKKKSIEAHISMVYELFFLFFAMVNYSILEKSDIAQCYLQEFQSR